jgi:hypothetical protein
MKGGDNMAVPMNPPPHPKPIQDIAAELAVAALRTQGNVVSIGEAGGKSVAEFYKAILEELRKP